MPSAIRFCADEVFESNCAVLTRYSDNTYAIKIIGVENGQSGLFQPIEQIKYKNGGVLHTATLYCDGIYYIELENESSICKKKIPIVKNPILKAETVGSETFAAIYGEACGKRYCAFFGYDEDYRLMGEYYVDSINIDKEIVITINTCDMWESVTEMHLEVKNAFIVLKEKKVEVKRAVKNIDKLIPYYFLEALQVENYDTAKSLLNSESYKDVEAVQLKNFFGEFTDVMQNSYEKEYANFPAVREKINECCYRLKYFDFVVKRGLIENITEI